MVAIKDFLVRHLDALPISEYHRSYLRRMLPAIDYYLDIYRHCLGLCARGLSKPLSEASLVDYGGGHGLLSLLAKQLGWGRVLYVDVNPQATDTARVLHQALGVGADSYLTADSKDLRSYCQQERFFPDAVLGMDVIEHVYRLDPFVDDLAALGHPALLFTTASNPCNPFVCHRLRRYMRGDETGTTEQPNYYTLRRRHIAQLCPDFDEDSLHTWAAATRGLTFGDVDAALRLGHLPVPDDPFNTCDPRTGSWTERILPLDAYRQIFDAHHYSLSVSNGWYNTHSHLPKRYVARLLNRFDTICLAPFIILSAHSLPLHHLCS